MKIRDITSIISIHRPKDKKRQTDKKDILQPQVKSALGTDVFG
jgi:hypothetical protein